MQPNDSTIAIPRERLSQIEKRGGPPAHIRANRQLSRAYYILRDGGRAGVNRERFLTSIEHGGLGITQIATRVFELRKLGCVIDSFRANPSDAFVTYRLISAPANIEQRLDRREGYSPRKKNVRHWFNGPGPTSLLLFDLAVRQ